MIRCEVFTGSTPEAVGQALDKWLIENPAARPMMMTPSSCRMPDRRTLHAQTVLYSIDSSAQTTFVAQQQRIAELQNRAEEAEAKLQRIVQGFKSVPIIGRTEAGMLIVTVNRLGEILQQEGLL